MAIVASRVELDLRVILLDVNGRRHEIIDTFHNNTLSGYWSADGDYWLEAGYETVRVWRFTDNAPVYVVAEAVTDFSWSPVGSTLAYVEWRVDDNRYALVMYDMNSGTHVEFELSYNAREYTFYWSPDGQRLALQGGDRWGDSQHIINFYGMDGASEFYVGYDTMHYLNGEWIAPLLAQWLPDSQHALTYRQIEANHYQLVTYDGPTLNSRVLFDRASRPPSFAPDGRHAVVYQSQGDGESIQVIDTLSGDGRPPVRLFTRLSGLSDPMWSPDSQLISFITAAADVRDPTLQINSADGQPLWNYPNLPQWMGGFMWMECD